jgi:hypothetical protein
MTERIAVLQISIEGELFSFLERLNRKCWRNKCLFVRREFTSGLQPSYPYHFEPVV